MSDGNGALQSSIAMADGNGGLQLPTPLPPSPFPPPSVVTSRSPARSVARGSRRSAERWAWWREVNPLDDEPCAQPWSNTGLIDIEHAEQRRTIGSLNRHICSTCQVTYCDVDGTGQPCWSCGRQPDDDWDGKRSAMLPSQDSQRRHAPQTPSRPTPRPAPGSPA